MIINYVTPIFHNLDPESCLLSDGRNRFRKNSSNFGILYFRWCL
jgi:hypothetical protein